MTCSLRQVRGATIRLLGASALAAALPGAAFAQSSVTLYGLIDASAGSYQNAGPTSSIKKVQSGDMTTSFFAFKGSEDLGGGLKAMFNLEAFIGVDTGLVLGRPVGTSSTFFDRQANVGLGSNSLGSLFVGNNTTDLFVHGLTFNPFVSSMSFSPTMRHLFSGRAPYASVSGGQTSWLNSVQYFTPTLGGFSAGLQGAAGEGTGKSSYAGSAMYTTGPFSVGGVFQRYRSTALTDQKTWDVGASYDFTVVKVYGQYGKTEVDISPNLALTGAEYKMYQVGAKVPLGGGSILASYGNQKFDGVVANDYTNKVFSAGYDYFVSKRTDLYAVYMLDKTTSLDNGNTFAAGIRHRF